MHSSHPADSVRALKEIHSTDPNQQNQTFLIVSSCTNGLKGRNVALRQWYVTRTSQSVSALKAVHFSNQGHHQLGDNLSVHSMQQLSLTKAVDTYDCLCLCLISSVS